MTLPPFISFIGVIAARLKRVKFCFWVMDIQPGISIASGIFKPNSFIAKCLQFAADYISKHSDLIIVLDRFMKDHLIEQKAEPPKIKVVPVWPVMNRVYDGKRLDNPFRKEHGFGDKTVIMYSGNHAIAHKLDTLLQAAEQLRNNEKFLFVFIGGGLRVKDVTEFKTQHKLNNIIQLPFQPRERIYLSLGSADLQVVVLGEGQVGYTHPNKVYGAIFIGKPVIYIGPDAVSYTHLTLPTILRV